MRKTLLSLALLAAPFATAQQSEPLPQETLDTIIQNLKNGRNTAAMVEYIDSINRVPFSDDIYEITYKDKNNEILYVNKDGSYIFQADIISVPNALNITRERREALAAAKGIASEDDKKESAAKNPDDPPPKAGKQKGDGQFAALPVALAQKEKKGDGSRRLWIVTAPDCDMCKTLEEQLGSISDVTLYRYLYTASDAARQRALAINCHHNPPEALRDHLLYGLHSEEAPKEDCAAREGEKLKQIKEETGDADRAELPVLTFPDGYETRVLAATSEELDSWITMHQPAKSDDKPAEAEPVTNTDGNATAATDNPAPASGEDSDPTPTDIQPAAEDREPAADAAPVTDQPVNAHAQPAPDGAPAANPNGGRVKIDAPPIRPRP